MELVEGRRESVAIKDLKEEADVAPGKVTAALNRLEEQGVVEILPGGEVKPTTTKKLDAQSLAEEAVREQEVHRQYRQARVELMKDYAETKDCRRRYLLNYFGEAVEGPCDHCDNFDAGTVEKHEAVDDKLPFPLKSRVRHKKWGEATVMRYEEDDAKIVLLFEQERLKSLVTQFVLDNQIVERA